MDAPRLIAGHLLSDTSGRHGAAGHLEDRNRTDQVTKRATSSARVPTLPTNIMTPNAVPRVLSGNMSARMELDEGDTSAPPSPASPDHVIACTHAANQQRRAHATPSNATAAATYAFIAPTLLGMAC